MSETTPTSPDDATPAVEHPTDQAAPVDAEARLSPVVAAEVAQELSSLARTMFELTLLEADVLAPEQLDPQQEQGSSHVTMPESSAATQPVETPLAPPMTPAAGPQAPSPDGAPASIALPDVAPAEAEAAPVAAETAPAADVPAAIPVPEVGETPAPAPTPAEPSTPAKPRTMALLDEISFLDE